MLPTKPTLEARYVSCAHCGHEARTGMKMSRRSGQLTRDSRCACPRCGRPADIRSRISSGKVLEVYGRMPLFAHPVRLVQSRLTRIVSRLRKPALAGIAAALAAIAATPAMAPALTRAMEHEVAARSAWPAAHDAEGFCDARIQAFRRAPATAPSAWAQLAQQCPGRAEIIAELSDRDR